MQIIKYLCDNLSARLCCCRCESETAGLWWRDAGDGLPGAIKKFKKTTKEPVVAGPESADTLDDKVYGYSELEVRPKFNGGDVNEFSKWVSARLVYPKDARDAGKEGRVYVQFTINRDGSVSDISLMEGICESIDNEVIRVVSESPVWTPGYIDGKPVNVTYAFPVIFRL